MFTLISKQFQLTSQRYITLGLHILLKSFKMHGICVQNEKQAADKFHAIETKKARSSMAKRKHSCFCTAFTKVIHIRRVK